MAKIRVKYFGPIKEGYQDGDGYIDLKSVTVFIGNQGSGKSTVAKLISTFSWIEKALTRGDYDIKWFTKKNKLKNQYLTYHRIENYFQERHGKEITEIDYVGEAYRIHYLHGVLEITALSGESYPLPQIMYVPAERNFIANVKSPKALKLTSDSLVEFVTEFDHAKAEIKGPMALPINNALMEYDKLNDIVNIKGSDYKLRLTEASSGFQSLVPLYLVSWFLANSVRRGSETSQESMSSEELERFRKGVAEVWANDSFTEEQRRVALSVLSSKFNKTAFLNIVEEPEQNLFPKSQWEMLKSLLVFNGMSKHNKLVITTHSPYIIAYLSIAIQAHSLSGKVGASVALREKLDGIIPNAALISGKNVCVYQMDEKTGTIVKLPDYEGVPTDKNYLNESLAESNELFDELLEIEQLI